MVAPYLMRSSRALALIEIATSLDSDSIDRNIKRSDEVYKPQRARSIELPMRSLLANHLHRANPWPMWKL